MIREVPPPAPAPAPVVDTRSPWDRFRADHPTLLGRIWCRNMRQDAFAYVFASFRDVNTRRVSYRSALAAFPGLTRAEYTAIKVLTATAGLPPTQRRTFVWCDVCSRFAMTHEHCEQCSEDGVPHPCRGICAECDGCDAACSCFTCDCGRRVREGEECDNCRERECNECGAMATLHNECDHCPECCACYGERIHHVTEGDPWLASSPADRRTFRSTRTIGVEWEFNNCARPRKIEAWADRWRGGIHSDGSCGEEIVTPPIAGDHIRKCLSDLANTFEVARARADTRCGIHVHVDAKDFTWTEMRRLVRLYSHVEAALYLLGGQQRVWDPQNIGQRSQYAQPCGQQFARALTLPDWKNGLLMSVYRGEDGREKLRNGVSKKDGGRYRGLNLCPWLARYGRQRARSWGRTSTVDPHTLRCRTVPSIRPDSTVEFRIHENTLDGDRVISWAQLCCTLLDWTAQATERDLTELVAIPSLTALTTIAPTLTPWIVDRFTKWQDEHLFNRGIVYGTNGDLQCAV